MLKNTVDGQFSTIEDIAETTLFFAAHETNALTGIKKYKYGQTFVNPFVMFYTLVGIVYSQDNL